MAYQCKSLEHGCKKKRSRVKKIIVYSIKYMIEVAFCDILYITLIEFNGHPWDHRQVAPTEIHRCKECVK